MNDDDRHDDHSPGLTLASDAILSWTHRYGTTTSCPARLRGTRDPAAADRLLLTVVLSELRGHYILSDVAGAANSARAARARQPRPTSG